MTIGGTVFLAPFDLPNSKGIMARLSFRRAQGKALKFASVALPAIRQAILDLFARPPPRQCPHCDMFLADIAKPKVPK